jgi:hypothetical protein
MGQLKANEKVTTQSDSLAFAVDATFKYQGIHAQFEFITRQLKFTDAGRTVAFSVASLGSHYPADGFRYGGYLLLGYRFEWLGTMPYVVLQRTGGIDTASQQRDFATPLVFGLNFRPIDALVLKIEYAHVMFDKGQVFPNEAIRVGGLQLAWAF